MLRSQFCAMDPAVVAALVFAAADSAGAATLHSHPAAKQCLFPQVTDIQFDPLVSLPHDTTKMAVRIRFRQDL